MLCGINVLWYNTQVYTLCSSVLETEGGKGIAHLFQKKAIMQKARQSRMIHAGRADEMEKREQD